MSYGSQLKIKHKNEISLQMSLGVQWTISNGLGNKTLPEPMLIKISCFLLSLCLLGLLISLHGNKKHDSHDKNLLVVLVEGTSACAGVLVGEGVAVVSSWETEKVVSE